MSQGVSVVMLELWQQQSTSDQTEGYMAFSKYLTCNLVKT
jgi:hypothetical protein